MSGRGGGRGGGGGPQQRGRGANSQPAVMLMPPHVRATFMPAPPLRQVPPIKFRRKQAMTGCFQYLKEFGTTNSSSSTTTKTAKKASSPSSGQSKNQNQNQQQEEKRQQKMKENEEKLQPSIDEYRNHQRDCGGEFQGMNCYNTLFIGRLAYEVTERKLLREMESFGPVHDIKIVTDPKTGKSRGYGFVEYEHEEDMKRAYRAADGMRIEGRPIVVDVERGHTVPIWLPRRLGGGLGGRGKSRVDRGRAGGGGSGGGGGGGHPPQAPPPLGYGGGGGGGGMGRGGGGRMSGPPPPMNSRDSYYGGGGRGPPPGHYGDGGGGGGNYYGGGGGPGPDRDGGGDRRRRRPRSPSPERDRGRYGPRRRY